MRKLISLILAATLLLGLGSALADQDFTGTWYMQQYGLTSAIFDLKEDGTCTATVLSAENPAPVEGTWSAEGDNVTITYEGQSVSFTFDGTDLVLSADSFAASLGVPIPEGTDLSALTELMRVSREPGKVTSAELSAYQADGTLPEGKTKEDMDAISAEMQTLAMKLFGLFASAGDSIMEGAAGTDSSPVELETVEENFYTRESPWGQEAVYLAKVKNPTEDNVSLTNGTLILKDAQGAEVTRREYFSTCGSRYLEPGEVTVIFFNVDLEEGQTAEGYEVVLEASSNGYVPADVNLDIDGLELRTQEGWSSSLDYLSAATLTNSGEEKINNISIVFLLRDSEGRMIEASSWGLGMLELHASSTITIVDMVNSSAAKYCEDNGQTLSSVEAFAWRELSNN